MRYKRQNIQNALTLLNNLEIKGIDNAKRIVMIAQILSEGEDEDGKDCIQGDE